MVLLWSRFRGETKTSSIVFSLSLSRTQVWPFYHLYAIWQRMSPHSANNYHMLQSVFSNKYVIFLPCGPSGCGNMKCSNINMSWGYSTMATDRAQNIWWKQEILERLYNIRTSFLVRMVNLIHLNRFTFPLDETKDEAMHTAYLYWVDWLDS